MVQESLLLTSILADTSKSSTLSSCRLPVEAMRGQSAYNRFRIYETDDATRGGSFHFIGGRQRSAVADGFRPQVVSTDDVAVYP